MGFKTAYDIGKPFILFIVVKSERQVRAMKITLVGLGVGKGALSLNALTAIKSASKVICKTQLTESAKIFAEQNIQVTYLDDIFKSSKNCF